MISTRTKQGVTAIVILLLCWAFLYGLFPRLSVILSQLIYPIKSNQLAILEKDQIRLGNEKEFEAQVNKLIDSGENSEENQQAIREKYHARLVASLQELDRDMEKRAAAQMMIAINISRLSPVSCFIRPMTEIGQTGWVQYENFKSEVGRFGACTK